MIGNLETFDLYGHEGFTPATIDDYPGGVEQSIADRLARIDSPIIADTTRIPMFGSGRNPLQNGGMLTIWEQYQVPILVGVGTLIAIAMFKKR